MTTLVLWFIYPQILPIGIFLGFLIFVKEKYKVIKQIREEKEFARIYEISLKDTRHFRSGNLESYRSDVITQFEKFKVK